MARQASSQDELYDGAFYASHNDGSYRSALVYCSILQPFLQPRSVLDIGCGQGTWLKAFGDHGAVELVGVDGPWNSREQMVEGRIEFHQMDLDSLKDLLPTRRFDLAMSVEVAEHLAPSTGPQFITALTDRSDVVLFGAAYPGQGGEGHINEQPQSYWAGQFQRRDYDAFDLFRRDVWQREDVEFWYQQNTFLYVRRGSEAHDRLLSAGLSAVANSMFLDVVHPTMYQRALSAQPQGQFRDILRAARRWLVALGRRVVRRN